MPNEQDGGGGTILGVASRLGARVINALAPQFLALIVINMLFMALFMWYVDARAEHTTHIMQQLLDKCLAR